MKTLIELMQDCVARKNRTTIAESKTSLKLEKLAVKQLASRAKISESDAYSFLYGGRPMSDSSINKLEAMGWKDDDGMNFYDSFWKKIYSEIEFHAVLISVVGYDD